MPEQDPAIGSPRAAAALLRLRLRYSQDIAPLLILLAVTVAALWPVCNAKFVRWDDQVILYRNPSLNPPTWSSLRNWWTTPHQRLYTPVAYTVWGALAWLARVPRNARSGISLDPRVFHTANLILHLITSILAYFLLKRLVGWRWPAMGGALVFAIHPVQVESVAHASGIQGLLCGLFSLTAVSLYIRAIFDAEPPGALSIGGSGRFQIIPYAAATIAFLLALLSKPAAMTVPMLAGVLHVFWLRRCVREALWRLWPWLLLALPCALVTKVIQRPPTFDVIIPLYDRPLIAGFTLAFYLYKIVMPWRLGIVYSGTTPGRLSTGDAIYYSWLVPVGIGVALWQRREKLRPVVAGALWFLIALSPVLGFTHFDFQIFATVADRYLYLPMFGVAAAVAWGLALPECQSRRWQTLAAMIVVLAALGTRAWFQTLTWRDTESLFRNAYRINHMQVATPSNDDPEAPAS